MSYQIRDGKPQCGYYGLGPDSEDYEAMAEYLELKKLRRKIRKQIFTKNSQNHKTPTKK